MTTTKKRGKPIVSDTTSSKSGLSKSSACIKLNLSSASLTCKSGATKKTTKSRSKTRADGAAAGSELKKTPRKREVKAQTKTRVKLNDTLMKSQQK